MHRRAWPKRPVWLLRPHRRSNTPAWYSGRDRVVLPVLAGMAHGAFGTRTIRGACRIPPRAETSCHRSDARFRIWRRKYGLRSPAWPETLAPVRRANSISRAEPPRSRSAAPAPRQDALGPHRARAGMLPTASASRRGARGFDQRAVSPSLRSNEACDCALGPLSLCGTSSPRHIGTLLCARRQRPRRRAAEQRDELASPHVLPLSQGPHPTTRSQEKAVLCITANLATNVSDGSDSDL